MGFEPGSSDNGSERAVNCATPLHAFLSFKPRSQAKRKNVQKSQSDVVIFPQISIN